MRKIYKYELTPGNIQHQMKAEIPHDAIILSVGTQGGKVVVWADVDVDSYERTMYFFGIPTGEESPENCEFLNTITFNNGWGNFVFHVFKVL
jgi:hypothetical protein